MLWSFGSLSGAQTNPLVTLIAVTVGSQRCAPSLARILGQFLGAAVIASLVSKYAPYTFVRDHMYVALHPLAEAVAAFGFILIALGVAHRRDARVPVALGAYATASLWMTGRATVGNPLLSVAVLMVAAPEQCDVWSVAEIAAASVAGAGLAVPLALFLFPQAKKSASALLFTPRQRSR